MDFAIGHVYISPGAVILVYRGFHKGMQFFLIFYFFNNKKIIIKSVHNDTYIQVTNASLFRNSYKSQIVMQPHEESPCLASY